MGALRNVLKLVLINIAVLVLLFVFLEGAASTMITTYSVLKNRGVAERFHSRYDETLGWASMPNMNLPDQYGPGASLQTNSQAFRNDHDITREVPPGKTRIVCSGDSFTLGFGVSNDQAWCQQLVAIDPRLETVNMGQGGYGIDQAYLWYMRDGKPLDQSLLLFGFITDDFHRMQVDRFLGYGKPMLELRGDSLVIANYPVPHTSGFTRWLAASGHSIANLKVSELSSLIAKRLSRSRADAAKLDSANAREQRARAVASKIFANLARTTREKNAKLVLLYLAGPGDYRGDEATPRWQRFVHEEGERQGIPVIDFIEIFRRVPPAEINSMFATNSHYSVKGNEFVAKMLYAELKPLLAPPTASR